MSSVWGVVSVKAIARMAAPPDAAKDLMGLWVAFGFLKEVTSVWSDFVVMAGNGLLGFVS